MRAAYNIYDEQGRWLQMITGDVVDEHGHLDYPDHIVYEGKRFECVGRDFFNVVYIEVKE